MSTVQDIIDQVSRRLRDTNKKTWKQDILVASMNSAFQNVVNVRPDSSTVHRDVTLVSGHEQQIDDDLYKLVHVLHNVDDVSGIARRAITKANMGTMDSVYMHWRTDKPRGYIEHYMLDEMDDKVFYVWPPAVGERDGVKPVIPDVPVDPSTIIILDDDLAFDFDNGSVTADNSFLEVDADGRGFTESTTATFNRTYYVDSPKADDGRYYYEMERISEIGSIGIGVYKGFGSGLTNQITTIGAIPNSYGLYVRPTSRILYPGTATPLTIDNIPSVIPAGSIIGCELEISNGGTQFDCRFYLNGLLFDTSTSIPGLASQDWKPAASSRDGGIVRILTLESELTYLPDGAVPWGVDPVLQDELQDNYDTAITEYNQAVTDLSEYNKLPGGETVRLVGATIPCIENAVEPTSPVEPVNPGPVEVETRKVFNAYFVINKNRKDIAIEITDGSFTVGSLPVNSVIADGEEVVFNFMNSQEDGWGASPHSVDMNDMIDYVVPAGEVGDDYITDIDHISMAYKYVVGGEVVSSEIYDANDPIWSQAPNQMIMVNSVTDDAFGVVDSDYVSQSQLDFDNYVLDLNQYEIDLETYNQAIVEFEAALTFNSEMPFNKTHWPAIMEWMLYYCYAVDDELTANNQRAGTHFQNFFNLMGVKVQNSLRIMQVRDEVDS